MLLLYAFRVGLRQTRQTDGSGTGEEDEAIQMEQMLKDETAIPTPDDGAIFWMVAWFPANDYPRNY